MIQKCIAGCAVTFTFWQSSLEQSGGQGEAGNLKIANLTM